MSPDQIKTLRHLSRLFEEGTANATQIKALSELLSTINKNQDLPDLNNPDNFMQMKTGIQRPK